MIVPSIDLIDGDAVQLVGGKKEALNAGDPRPLARRFRLAGEIAVIDLDAAMGKGSNRETIEELCALAPCRVGGGIRSVDTAMRWLDAGAHRIILGTAARPELLRQLPRERVIAAVDAVEGDVVVEGWTKKSGHRLLERIEALRPYVGGFLVTFVEREGRLDGTDEALAKEVVQAAGDADVTIAGGVTTTEEVATLDALGADAQVGMALYRGLMDLGDAIAAPLTSDRDDGLYPTVVCDAGGRALGLVYSDDESIRRAVETGRGVYHSRRRGLWEKGKTSGATQELVRIDLDCDRDALRFMVRQQGDGFCHLSNWTCWDDRRGLNRLQATLRQRLEDPPPGSYVARLFADDELLGDKLREEAQELAEAAAPEEVIWESADMLFFAMAKMVRRGVTLEEVEAELDRRAQKVSRRSDEADDKDNDQS